MGKGFIFIHDFGRVFWGWNFNYVESSGHSRGLILKEGFQVY